VKAAAALHVGVDRRMVIQILAIINGGVLDFPDGFVDLFDGVLFFVVHVVGRSQLTQVSARMAQVGERVQVSRMPSRFVSESQGRASGKKKHEYGAMSYSFHSLLIVFLVMPFGRNVFRR
jgi:hypothetical protein